MGRQRRTIGLSHEDINGNYNSSKFERFAVENQKLIISLEKLINEKFENNSNLNYVYKEVTIHFLDGITQDKLYIQDVFSHISRKIYQVIRFLKTEAVLREDELNPLTEEKLKKIIGKVLSMVLDAYSFIKPEYKTQYQGFLDIFIKNLEIPRDLIGK